MQCPELLSAELQEAIARNVTDALAEDIGSGDLTAALIDVDQVAGARIVARENAVIAGQPWVDELFLRLDPGITIDWYIADGQRSEADDIVCKLVGNARALLSGERAALNFLQTLSATATQTARYVDAIAGTAARLLDTRKTLPGLRLAQKYAVRMGGGSNHRVGLFDAILIKENHIARAGGIQQALDAARSQNADVLIEIEVESLDELHSALACGARRVLLDNFTLDELEKAVEINAAHNRAAELEASGNVTLDTVRKIAETGVDYISTGAVTKNVAAIDLSMQMRID